MSNGLSAYTSSVIYNDNVNLFAGNYDGLSISTDNGVKWETTSLVNSQVTSIFVEGNNIFAGGKGLKISTDYGKSFSQSINQFHSILDIKKSDGYLYAAAGYYLFVSSNNGSSWEQRQINYSICRNLVTKNKIVFAGCSGSLYMNNGGVYKSTNHGNNWLETSLINFNVEFFESNSNYLFAGNSVSLFKSLDGDSWIKLNLPSGIENILNVLVLEENLFVCGSYSQGLEQKTYVSNDNGFSWKEFSLRGELISIVKKSQDIIASILYRGVYISLDQGVTWGYFLHKDVSVRTLYRKNARLFAGTNNYGMYYSDDKGLNWKLMNSTAGSIEAFTSNDLYLFAGTFERGIYRSPDNGASWENVSLGNRTINAVHYFDSRLFADDAYVGIKYSTNNGSSWFGNSISGSVTYCFTNRNNKLFAGLFSQGIYYSTDSGNSWILSMLNNASINQIEWNSQYMFAASSSQPGIFRSSDDGINWEPMNLNRVSWSVIVSENIVIAGTGLSGVYVSTDNGIKWRSKNENLGSNNVLSLLQYGEYVFSGLSQNGIYRITMSELTDIWQTSINTTEKYALNQNFPNPFNPATIISFSIPKKNFVELKVFDITGKLVQNLINEFKTTGNYEFIFDGRNLPTGIYYYKLKTDEFTQTKKMMLIK